MAGEIIKLIIEVYRIGTFKSRFGFKLNELMTFCPHQIEKKNTFELRLE
jgi:hypothetical protein